jgi:3-hydroxybutyryl-CoA dehydrogenase
MPEDPVDLAEGPIAVIGCGLMGSGIAEVVARADFDVVIIESSEATLRAGRERIARSLDRALTASKIDEVARDRALAHMRFESDLEGARESTVLFEAIAEDETVKLDLYRSLDRIVESPAAVFGSNTSSIPIARIAAATARPERVVGVHFFNPVPVMTLVELTPSLLTDTETIQRFEKLVAEGLGKTIIRSTDRAGFIVNALLAPYVLSAVRMLESGIADAESIDIGMERGCAVPMGPLRLADFIGLDTLKSIADAMYQEFKEPLYAPPPLLLRLVDAGLLGRKTGRGFYSY